MKLFKILFLSSLTLTFIISCSAKHETKTIVSKEWKMPDVLDKALLEKDTAKLNQILHKNLTLGHSNGWTETKKTLIESLPTSKVHYEKFIPIDSIEMIHSGTDLKTIRRKLIAVGEYEGESFEVQLNILEVWVKEKENWQLLARQSVDSPE